MRISVVPANAGTQNHRVSLNEGNEPQHLTDEPRRMGPGVRRGRRKWLTNAVLDDAVLSPCFQFQLFKQPR